MALDRDQFLFVKDAIDVFVRLGTPRRAVMDAIVNVFNEDSPAGEQLYVRGPRILSEDPDESWADIQMYQVLTRQILKWLSSNEE